jgi:hypothetical protein
MAEYMQSGNNEKDPSDQSSPSDGQETEPNQQQQKPHAKQEVPIKRIFHRISGTCASSYSRFSKWLFIADSNHVIAVATVAAALIAFFYTRYEAKQLSVMQQTLEHSVNNDASTAVQTDKLVSASQQAELHLKQMVADNKQALADNKDAIEHTLRENRQELSTLLAQNRDADKVLAEQDRSALDATLKASQLDQRPWVYIVRWKLSEDPTANKEFTIILGPINTGKTPAFDLMTISEISAGAEEPSILTDIAGHAAKTSKTPPSYGILPPSSTGGIVNFHYSTGTLKFDEAQLAAYHAGVFNIYIQSIINYRDTFGQQYQARVCAYHAYGMPLDELSLCRQGNSIDH